MKHRIHVISLALALAAAPVLAAPPQQGMYTGTIEYVEPMEGPWLALFGAEGRRIFYCGDFAGDCGRWMCRDLGRRLTVRYVHVAEVLADGEPFEADTLTRIDGPTGPVDAELGRVRCAAQGMVAGAQTQGGPAAANSLGVWYEKGRHGLPQDPEIAAYWYGQAAHYGNALAMHNLGDLYRQGKGVKQDGGEAFRWYKKAAEAGHAIGLEDMADCTLKGIGVDANRAEALRLYREAAQKGRKSAAQKLRELEAAAPATSPAALVGEWSDEDSHGRCSMSITQGRDGRLVFEVSWPDSAFVSNRWRFSGVWDAKSGTLNYDNGRLVTHTSRDNWQTFREELKYEGGTGTVSMKGGALYWNDHKDNICKDCVFKKAP